MTKESTYELQKIDCNCNDCGYMVRDFEKFQWALELHRTWQFSAYEIKKKKIIERAEKLAEKQKFSDAEVLFNEANKLKPEKMQNVAGKIQYGKCALFNKPVSFIPNTCQIETQNCFVHRKDW